MNFSIDIIDIINNNSGDITFTVKPPYRLTSSVKHGGTKQEQKIYNIIGFKKTKGKTTVATIEIATLLQNPRRFFKNKPSLNSNSNITLKWISTKNTKVDSGDRDYREGNYPILYTFDLIYNVTKSTSKQSGVTANLIYKDLPQPKPIFSQGNTSNTIVDIDYGANIINKNGESKVIKLIGTPGVEGRLSITDEVGNNVLSTNAILKHPGYSFSPVPTSVVYDSEGKETLALRWKIPSNGIFKINVDFPSVISRSTAVNGSMAASGTDKIKFDNLSNVEAGDRVILVSAPDETTSIVVTHLNPDGDDENECTVAPNLTAADNAEVQFKRSKKYTVRLHNDEFRDVLSYSSKMLTKLKSGCIINQYVDPVLTLKASGSTSYTITQFNGVATSLGSGAAHYHEKKYAGIASISSDEATKRNPSIIKSVDFSYLLTASGGKDFEIIKTPRFLANTPPEFGADGKYTNGSNWTNTIPRLNGGMEVDITNITLGAEGSNTILISGTLNIIKWGIEDVTMEIDFDKIFNYTS